MKTLKDLEKTGILSDEVGQYLIQKELKQAAIEWVRDASINSSLYLYFVIIKHFFNLTDEKIQKEEE